MIINLITITLPTTMIKIIDGASKKSITFEIIDGYETNDEKSIEKLFDEKLASGITKVNLLVKIDKMNITKSSWKAMWDDGLYVLKHIKNCGHIAIVGNSKLEEFLVTADNTLFGNEKAGRVEKYFYVEDMNNALGWINE